MRLRHHISDHNKPDFTAALDELGVRYKTKAIGGTDHVLSWDCFDLLVYDDDPKWPLLRDLAAEHRVRVWHSPVFTDDDIAAALWLFAHATADAGYPQPKKAFGYESESFDLTNWCRRCGIGKVQTRPIRLRQEPTSKSAHFFAPQCLHHVLLARLAVREVFEAENVSGVRYLAPLRHRTGTPLETVVQILPTTTAREGLVGVVQELVTCSPQDKDMSAIQIPAPGRGALSDGFCHRVKYHVPSRKKLVHYLRNTFEEAPDILLSAEWFGSGAAASQQVIISNKVARLVLAHRWKGLELEPIELV